MMPLRLPISPLFKHRRLAELATAAPATSNTHTPSIAGAVSLPDDILFDILSRVPVKSACRFRCVSNEWYTLISDPEFAAAHKSRHTDPLIAVLSFQEEPSKLDADLRLVDIDGNVVPLIKIKDGGGSRKITGPGLNDLICIPDGHFGACIVDPATGEVLWTRSRLKVSPRPANLWTDVYWGTNFAFGFGRAIPSDEYKLVCLVNSESCQILSVRDGIGWRPTLPPPTRVTCWWTCVVVVNGIMHVLASRDIDRDIIHCFDLESESWKDTIEGPQKVVDHELWKRTTTTVAIAELKGSICIVQEEARTQVTNIWLLTDSDNWIKTYTIPMAPGTYLHIPLGMTHDGGRLLFRCIYIHTLAKVVRIYNPCTNTCEDVMKTPAKRVRLSVCNLHLGSLISAKI